MKEEKIDIYDVLEDNIGKFTNIKIQKNSVYITYKERDTNKTFPYIYDMNDPEDVVLYEKLVEILTTNPIYANFVTRI